MGDSSEDIPMRVPRELLAGGLSNAIASTLLNPMDVIKIRLQTEGQLEGTGAKRNKMYGSFSRAAQRIIAEEGIFARHGGLWIPGLQASLLREFGYSSFRFGMYPVIKDLFHKDSSEDIGLFRRMGAALTTVSHSNINAYYFIINICQNHPKLT